MKILVAGYACSPCGGSEPGVGWAAVCRIARNHEVFVLTDIHNQVGWETGRQEGRIPTNVSVRFLRDRSNCSSNRMIAHVQSWLNYAEFNGKVLSAAESWHREKGFDLCHQVTIASWRMPSPLWKLPIPFIWGPIGGAGYIPRQFRSMLSPASRAFECARDISTIRTLRAKEFKMCIENTAVVFAANEETERLIHPARGNRPIVRLPIASVTAEMRKKFQRPETDSPQKGALHLFAGGNMEGRKGVGIALQALAIAKQRGLDFRYTVAGGGPEIPKLKAQAEQLGIAPWVNFPSGFQGDEYVRALWQNEVYFLPSFRESTPVTLLEAILAGCYPLVADTSAQGEIVRLVGGHAVPVKTIDQLVESLADGLMWCDENRNLLAGLAKKSAEIVSEHFSSESYDAKVSCAYSLAMSNK